MHFPAKKDLPHGVEDPGRTLVLTDGTVEALKWLALALMTLDHVNKFIFDYGLPGGFEAGRIAMPLFSFVLAYNLARPGTLEAGIYRRTAKRLVLFGLLATPFFIALGDLPEVWLPLNIMFSFLVALGMIALLQREGRFEAVASVVLLLAGGAVVEYLWFGPLLCAAAWWYCRMPERLPAFLLLAGATALLFIINRNLWAMAALPIILVAPYVNVPMPRIRYAFYVYYPAHLAVLYLLQHIRP